MKKNLRLIFLLLFPIVSFFFLPIKNPYVRYSFAPKIISKKIIQEKLKTLSKLEIQKLIDAGNSLLFWDKHFKEIHQKRIYEEMTQNQPMMNWKHYPENDVIDFANQSQYFWHKHRGNETGHFHIFYRLKSLKEEDPLYIPKGKKVPFLHFIAISLNKDGYPIELFTTNQWVTNEVWLKVNEIQKYLEYFQIKVDKPSTEINEWMNTLIYYFKIPILVLLEERDRQMNTYFERFDRTSVLRDHSIEIVTQIPLTVREYLELLQETIDLIDPSNKGHTLHNSHS